MSQGVSFERAFLCIRVCSLLLVAVLLVLVVGCSWLISTFAIVLGLHDGLSAIQDKFKVTGIIYLETEQVSKQKNAPSGNRTHSKRMGSAYVTTTPSAPWIGCYTLIIY